MTAIWPAGPPKESRPTRTQVRVASENVGGLRITLAKDSAWRVRSAIWNPNVTVTRAAVMSVMPRAACDTRAYVNAIPQFQRLAARS